MRARSRDSTGLTSVSNAVVLGPRSGRLAALSLPYQAPWNESSGTIESIEDEVGDYGGENPVTHFKTVHVLGAPHYVSVDYTHPTDPNGSGNVFTASLTGSYEALSGNKVNSVHVNNHLNADGSVKSTDIPDYIADAFDAMYPDIKAEMSLLNSVYELKDFRHMDELLSNSAKTIRDMLKSIGAWERSGLRARRINGRYELIWGQISGGFRKKTPRQMIREAVGLATGNFLQWKFAIAPLIRDVQSVRKALGSYKSKVDALLANADKPLRSHWGREISTNELGINIISPQAAPRHEVNTAKSYYITNSMLRYPRVSVTMAYSYGYDPHVRRHAYELGLLDSFGIQFNLAHVWNAVRFTFLIDWLLDVGHSMDRMRSRNLEPRLSVAGASNSISYEMETLLWRCPFETSLPYFPVNGLSLVGAGPAVGIKRSTKVYIRKECTLTLFALPKLGALSPMEAILGGALAGSFWAGGGHYSGPRS